MDVEAKLAALSPDWSRLLLFLFYQQNGTVLFSVRLLLACFQQQQCGTAVPRTFARHGTEPLLVGTHTSLRWDQRYWPHRFVNKVDLMSCLVREKVSFGTVAHFVVIWQLMFDYELNRFKRFISYETII